MREPQRARRWVLPFTVVAVLLATGITAAEDTKDALAAPIAAVEDALKHNDAAAAKTAFDEVVRLRTMTDAEGLERLTKATADGVRHKDPAIAIAAMETLGKLKAPTKLLGKYLRPPSRLDGNADEAKLYVAAVRVAGEIHDKNGMRQLERLVTHRTLAIGETATKALANYADLEPKQRLELIKRLVKVLQKFEAKLGKSGLDSATRHRVYTVRAHLITTIGKIAEYRAATTAADWKEWLRTEGRRQLKTG